jgi:hypothetical protein
MEGAWHWPVEPVVLLAEPVACKGELGFWRLPGNILAAVQAAAENESEVWQ